eukprot:TRINITY_DN3641_c0_g2_i1.p1 TRINITY_DN3641_c0_g2~~TRINITY_DN3641_c0_g2_i1.p1  ORF type:complete len:132 (-),score=2.24 TRINITY_DN3641_c0_g2_i1:366-761(-)
MSDKPPQLHKDFQGYGRTSSFRPNPHYEKWLNYRENYRTTLSAIRGRQVFQMLAWGIVVPIGLWKLCVHTQVRLSPFLSITNPPTHTHTLSLSLSLSPSLLTLGTIHTTRPPAGNIGLPEQRCSSQFVRWG